MNGSFSKTHLESLIAFHSEFLVSQSPQNVQCAPPKSVRPQTFWNYTSNSSYIKLRSGENSRLFLPLLSSNPQHRQRVRSNGSVCPSHLLWGPQLSLSLSKLLGNPLSSPRCKCHISRAGERCIGRIWPTQTSHWVTHTSEVVLRQEDRGILPHTGGGGTPEGVRWGKAGARQDWLP